MSNGYKGMHWWKCDLQMQTPTSPHWREPATKLRVAADEAELRVGARAYLERCHEVGLEVIAITDHNFAPDAGSAHFLRLLREENALVAQNSGKSPLVILPGFEIEAHVGTGTHMLAIFDQGIDLRKIDSKLSALGLGFGERYKEGCPQPSTATLRELLDEVQKDPSTPALVIAAHSLSQSGIFDRGRVSDVYQKEEYLNLDLLAVEIPKPMEQLSANIQKVFRNGSECDPAWKRSRPIACLMSSDCYRLRPDKDRPEEKNYIGCRHTWIKMSEPTIEALRQAFLDPEARIAYGDRSPDELRRHGRIVSMEIEGAATCSNLTVNFAPGLNCLIGGRGSGKSTLLEFLRFGLRREQTINSTSPSSGAAARQQGRFEKVLPQNLTVAWRSADGLEDTFVRTGSSGPTILANREVGDPATVFRQLGVEVFSQEQIAEIADQPAALFELVNRLVGEEVAGARTEAEKIAAEAMVLWQKQDQLDAAQLELGRLRQEAAELQRTWSAWSAIEPEIKLQQAAREAEAYLAQVEVRLSEFRERIAGLASEAAAFIMPAGATSQTWPEHEFFQAFEVRLGILMERVRVGLNDAGDTLLREQSELLGPNAEVERVKSVLAQATARFVAACEAKGLRPEELARVQEIDRQMKAKLSERETKRIEVERLQKDCEPLVERMRSLVGCWRRESVARKTALEGLVTTIVRPQSAATGTPFLQAAMIHQGDVQSFTKAYWLPLAPDRRRALGRDWEGFGGALIGAYVAQAEVGAEPKTFWHFVESWMNGTSAEGCENFEELRDGLSQHLRVEKGAQWRALRTRRLDDTVDFLLFRPDGTSAGSLLKRELSAGQKSTIILSLLLAKGDGPLLVDQPEDQVDSAFITQDLLPVIREAKRRRQLILVTHNANLPVNGDADLVYACEFKGGKVTALAQGGLDRPAVKKAVLDIMEGSKDAFRRRSEKYHLPHEHP